MKILSNYLLYFVIPVRKMYGWHIQLHRLFFLTCWIGLRYVVFTLATALEFGVESLKLEEVKVKFLHPFNWSA